MATPAFIETVMTALKEKLKQVGINCEVETEPVPGTKLHRLFVISKNFARMQHSERQNVVWRVAEKTLNEKELMRISMILTMTPDELG